MKFKSLALAAISALVLSACGGGGGGSPAIDAAPHIKGTIAGTMYNGTAAVEGSRYTITNSVDLYADTNLGPAEHRSHWGIYGLKSAVGTYNCDPAGDATEIRLHDTVTDVFYETDGGAAGQCQVRVVAVSATEISGTFTATFVIDNDNSATTKVTNGTFRVPVTDGGGSSS